MHSARFLTFALAVACISVFACHSTTGALRESEQERRRRATVEAGAPVTAASPAQIATLEDRRITESSGVVASRRNPDLFWTHNDSGDERREFIIVYRFAEPEVTDADAASTHESPRVTAPAEAIRIKYPDGAHNAEALLIHPLTGDLYVLTKGGDAAGVYKLAAPFDASAVNTLARVAVLHDAQL